ncbi:linker for activation of T-cells family member 2 isoform X4 [Trichechus manatus latirostris]|uniref:Linker for activation of T-cells family member 2 isoform X4 n=1 Tax=Trichechus manatus latirostris TaxID=127582 RepID=A0A2Y9RGG7_TRIMA|nr:linker for activation of T-cells family member 2 isoform X4 [Trichechus manatus latirostris]XP_023591059.1 linker for activation of T-cells family member 2 isoform X4 [Trichechus manatus latirostris]
MIQWLTGSPSPSLLPISVSGIGVSSGRCLGSGWGGRSEEPRLSGGLLGADMTTEPELLWTGVALLLLLGAAAGLCVRCSRPGAKKSEKIYEQRSLQENQQSFAVARTYSLIRQAWADPLVDAAPDTAQTRKDKLLQFSPSVEGSATPRYQNFSKETPLPWTITTGGSSGSPWKMRTTPVPTRTCSSAGQEPPSQSLSWVKHLLPWQEAPTRTTVSQTM